MTILEEIIQYSHNCINDTIPSGIKHKNACIRFLNDIKKSESKNVLSEEFPYYWNEEEAQRIVKWFTYLRHSKGVLAGKPIELNTWQKFDICQLYGWRYVGTDYKRFNKGFIEVARKNAKSQILAGIVLYEIATQSTKNNEVYETYCAGTKREQSKIIFEECRLMLVGSPLLSKFKITRDRITHKKTQSFLKALCKEDGKKGDGTNPAVLILDEYHQHQTTEFYALGLGSNTKESLLMIITTAGKELTYPCYVEEYSYCSKIVDPSSDVENDNYFVDILEIDEGDDISDERNWYKANPIRMTYEEGRKKIRDEYKIAKDQSEKMTDFLTKCLNKWVQRSSSGYMDLSKWKACEVDAIPYDTRGLDVFVGFDLSAKIDLTSVAFIIPYQTEELDRYGKKKIKYICYSHSFIPNQEKLRERIAVDKVRYDLWEEQGFLTITDSEIVDQNAVMDYVVRTCEANGWKINTLCFDPANASKIMIDLSNMGYNVEEVYQSHKSLNESTAGYREQVYCKNVMYTKNPLLNFSMSNAVIRTNNGLIKIDKDATTKRIDPIDAMLCAFKLALYYEFNNTTDIEEWLDSAW